jgi:hypothetical protein
MRAIAEQIEINKREREARKQRMLDAVKSNMDMDASERIQMLIDRFGLSYDAACKFLLRHFCKSTRMTR